jgi:hypothetical protein
MMVTIQVSPDYRGNHNHVQAIIAFFQNNYSNFGGVLIITNGIHEGRETRGSVLAYVYYFDFDVIWPNQAFGGRQHFYLGSYDYQIDPMYDFTNLLSTGNEVNSNINFYYNFLMQSQV